MLTFVGVVIGEVVQRGKGKCHPALNLSLRGGNRHAFDKPKEPCPLFERERLLIVQAGFNVEAMNDGAKEKEEIVLVESRTDTDAQGEGAGPSEGPSDIECGCCCSDYRFEEMVQVRYFCNLQLFLVARLFMCPMCCSV